MCDYADVFIRRKPQMKSHRKKSYIFLIILMFLSLVQASAYAVEVRAADRQPPAVTVSAAGTKAGFILYWNKRADVSGYEIQYSADKSFKNAKKLLITQKGASSRTIKNLKANKTYYVRMRTYVTSGSSRIYSRYSKAVSVATASSGAYLYKEGFYCEKIPAAVKKRMMGKSYRTNSHIKLSDLRYVRVLYYDYNGKIKSGELVVNRKIAKKTVKVFYELYQIKYPIQKMVLVDNYGGSDEKSMSANNTSAFNYRTISGSRSLSNHAYGMAIDLNPMVNPYVKNGRVSPANGKLYKERNVSKCRGKYKKNMIHKNDKVYKIFKKYGFTWGGDWSSPKDYQHFEARS
ncbi:fibronectin type III domain protein [Marvinbryantia formatexigens DSM 14469]|uniref:Fibronectin type III domain protein n=2 Tax=Marvinbryantia TaxID=248744 RepID=C6LBK9_9FIRM|nr:fibronectin type III domain protein [Marvinbryantia formatexigens DSM 14469]